MRVETPEGPLGQAAVEGVGDGGGTRLLADTRVGCMVALRPLGEEGGIMREKKVGRPHRRMDFPLFLFLLFLFPLFSFVLSAPEAVGRR